MKPETKTVIIEGVKILMQKCACGGWFIKSRKDKESCGPTCSALKCYHRDKVLLKKAKKWQLKSQKIP